jgi:hypothetical protein
VYSRSSGTIFRSRTRPSPVWITKFNTKVILVAKKEASLQVSADGEQRIQTRLSAAVDHMTPFLRGFHAKTQRGNQTAAISVGTMNESKIQMLS